MIANDLSVADYNSIRAWRWSHIKLMDQSPRAVWHAATNPSNDDARYAKLRAIHSLTLEPDAFGREFSVFDGVRRGKAYDEHVAAHQGTTVLTVAEYDDASLTADSVRANPLVRELMADGSPEVSLSWTDPATGLEVKGRADWIGSAGILDLKTCGTVNERAVAGMVARNLWHGQLAHYSQGMVAHGFRPPPCYIIAAEGKGARDVAVFQLDRGIPDGALHIGEGIRASLMQRLAACVASQDWPGRHESIVPLCLPTYALGDVADDLTGIDP
jgi:hypothetical protein